MIIYIFIGFLTVINAENFSSGKSKNDTLKPDSLCCDIPPLGDAPHLAACSDPKLSGPCSDIKCVFEQYGFLNNNSLNKDAYRDHLKKWAENHKGWTLAVDKAIEDCIDKEPKQLLDEPCKAYDVFTCTELAMTKKLADPTNVVCHKHYLARGGTPLTFREMSRSSVEMLLRGYKTFFGIYAKN